MKKRIVTIALVVALLATCFGGTLAYLTDKDAETNVFTVGTVDIKLLESKLHRQNDNAEDAAIIADAETYADYLAKEGTNMVPGRWVKKAPYVYNTGKNPAYVRVRVVFDRKEVESLYFMEYTTALEDKTNGIVKSMAVLNADGTKTAVADYQAAIADKNWTELEYTYTYVAPLEPGVVTYYAPFWQIAIKDRLDNKDLAELVADANGNIVQNAIEVYADAIQAEGFGSAAEAFAAFDAQMAAKN